MTASEWDMWRKRMHSPNPLYNTWVGIKIVAGLCVLLFYALVIVRIAESVRKLRSGVTS